MSETEKVSLTEGRQVIYKKIHGEKQKRGRQRERVRVIRYDEQKQTSFT